MAKDLIKKEQNNIVDPVNPVADKVKATSIGELMSNPNGRFYGGEGKLVSYDKETKQRIELSETGPFKEIVVSNMNPGVSTEERNKGIRALRKKGKKQKEIAEMSGLSQQRVSQILNENN